MVVVTDFCEEYILNNLIEQLGLVAHQVCAGFHRASQRFRFLYDFVCLLYSYLVIGCNGFVQSKIGSRSL